MPESKRIPRSFETLPSKPSIMRLRPSAPRDASSKARISAQDARCQRIALKQGSFWVGLLALEDHLPSLVNSRGLLVEMNSFSYPRSAAMHEKDISRRQFLGKSAVLAGAGLISTYPAQG